MNKLCLDKKILYICDCEYETFLNKTNVVGVGLGFKVINGFTTCKKCIKVLVSQKMPLNKLNEKNKIPKCYKGMVTDVVQTGNIKEALLNGRIRPVPGGYSIGPTVVSGGATMACLVTDGINLYVLSNNHVLAGENTVPIGTPIIQPGQRDRGKAPEDIVAYLSKFIEIKFSSIVSKPENKVDCAIAKVVNRQIVSSKIALIGDVKNPAQVELEEVVKKAGRTTQLTFGQITAIGLTLKIKLKRGKAIFKNQIVTSKMTEEGDSGSLLVDYGNHPIGLFFSDSNTHSFF